jgi:hypothetical protein
MAYTIAMNLLSAVRCRPSTTTATRMVQFIPLESLEENVNANPPIK